MITVTITYFVIFFLSVLLLSFAHVTGMDLVYFARRMHIVCSNDVPFCRVQFQLDCPCYFFFRFFSHIIINYWLMIPIYCFTDYLSLNNISKSCIPLLQWQPKPLEKKMHALVCWHGLLISIKVLKPIKNNSFNVPFSVISLPDLFIFAVVSGYILLLSHHFLTGWILLLLLILMFSF